MYSSQYQLPRRRCSQLAMPVANFIQQVASLSRMPGEQSGLIDATKLFKLPPSYCRNVAKSYLPSYLMISSKLDLCICRAVLSEDFIKLRVFAKPISIDFKMSSPKETPRFHHAELFVVQIKQYQVGRIGPRQSRVVP